MAFFSNYAELSYGGRQIRSNTVIGELTESISVTKTAVSADYTADGVLTYVITLINSGTETASDLTIADDLGAYTMGELTLVPLQYRAESLHSFVNGVPQTAPMIQAGPPLVISGLEIPAGGSLVLVYETTVTPYAPLAPGGMITKTALGRLFTASRR